MRTRTILLLVVLVGVALCQSPVLIQGTDGVRPRTVKTLLDGTVVTTVGGAGAAVATSVALADGVASNAARLLTPTGPVADAPAAALPMIFNGATWDRQFTCTQSAPITIPSNGTFQIIAGANVTRICHIVVGLSAASNIQLIEGTQAVSPCDTGTATLINTLPATLAYTDDFWGGLRTASGAAVCLVVTSNVTGGGVVTYAQF